MYFKRGSKILFGFSILIVSLVAASLACNLPQQNSPTPIPISPASAEELEQNIQQAAEDFEKTGQVEISITELQLTSYIAKQIQAQGDNTFSNPQVKLQDGQIQVEGDVQQNGIALPLKANVAVAANQNGTLDYDFVSASIGPFPLPENIINQISAYIGSSIDQNISTLTGNIFIEEILINDGVMFLKGRTR
jgi:uncharacterized protein YpmS